MIPAARPGRTSRRRAAVLDRARIHAAGWAAWAVIAGMLGAQQDEDRPRRVRVVDETGRRIAAANVEVSPLAPETERIIAGGESVEIRRHGRPLRTIVTGEDGEASLGDIEKGGARLRVVAGEMCGVTTVHEDMAGTPIVDVVLRPFRRCRVRAIDVSGRPAAGILFLLSGDPPAKRSDPLRLALATRTSKAGEAEFEIVDDEAAIAGASRVFVQAVIPGAESAVQTADLASGAASLEFELTGTTTLDIRVVDEVGRAIFPAPVVTWLVSARPPKGAKTDVLRDATWSKGQVLVPAEGGRITGLAPGSRVALSTDVACRRSAYRICDLDGAPAETSVTLELGPLMAEARIAFSDAEGRPARVHFALCAALRPADVAADAEQRWSEGPPGAGDAASVDLQNVFNGDTVGFQVAPDRSGVLELWPFLGRKPESVWRIPWPAAGPGEIRSLGPPVRETRPLLVAGRVVDQRGCPCPGVRVKVGFTTRGPYMTLIMPVLSAISDATGRFTIHAEPTNDMAYALSVEDAALGSEARAFEPGADDLVLVAKPHGTIEGRFRLADARLPADGIDLMLTSATGPMHVEPLRLEDGWFAFRHVMPGDYQVRVKVLDAWNDVGGVVHVRPGETARPPDLDPIVLGEGLRPFTVRVVDADGLPVERASVRFLPLSSGDWTSPHRIELTNAAGVATLWSRVTPCRIRVAPWGKRLLEEPFPDRDLLNPSFPLEVTVRRSARPPTRRRRAAGRVRLPLRGVSLTASSST